MYKIVATMKTTNEEVGQLTFQHVTIYTSRVDLAYFKSRLSVKEIQVEKSLPIAIQNILKAKELLLVDGYMDSLYQLKVLKFVQLWNLKQNRQFVVPGKDLSNRLVSNGVITIFGLGQADNFTYPAQEIVRIINLGFIDRFDIYGMILMTFGVYIRCSLFFRFAYDFSISEASSKWTKRIVFVFLVILTTLGTYYLASNHQHIQEAIDLYVWMIILYPIPIILWFISWRKKRRYLLVNKGKNI